MENNSAQNIKTLRADMMVLGEYLQEIAQSMMKHQISQYPIFIAHKEPAIQLGKAVIDAQKSKTNWSFNVSLLEELVNKKIVEVDKIESFKEVFSNAQEMACIFMATPEEMKFIWCPFDLSETE